MPLALLARAAVAGALGGCMAAAPQAAANGPALALPSGDAPVSVTFHNEMSPAFQLESAAFAFDDRVVYRWKSTGDQGSDRADPAPSTIFAGGLPPGVHDLSMVLSYRGNGSLEYAHLRGYRFEVKSKHPLTARTDAALRVQVTAYESGDSTAALEQRPHFRWTEYVGARADGADRP